MPDYDEDLDGYRAYQDATLKPFGLAVGRLLATADNPRGNPDLVVERAGQDTLGISTFLARPFTGRVVFVEATEGRRFSFYAPNVWMHEKRVLFPTFAVLGSHLSNAHQAEEVVRLLDSGAISPHAPAVREWAALAECHQLIHENRHAGTLAVRVGARPALDAARRAREVYAAWGSRYLDGATVRVRLDPVRPDAEDLVALVTVDSPPANAIGLAVLEDLERAVTAIEGEPRVRASVLAGSGTMFVAGADIRALRAFAGAPEVEEFTLRVQRLLVRIARLRAPMVAAVDGYALGGGNELQMACAWRVGAVRAEWGQPEINLHVLPGFGGTQSLPRLALRRARAAGRPDRAALLESLVMLLDGRRRGAEAARDLGLIDELAARGRPLPCAGHRPPHRARRVDGHPLVTAGRGARAHSALALSRPGRRRRSSPHARASRCGSARSARSRYPGRGPGGAHRGSRDRTGLRGATVWPRGGVCRRPQRHRPVPRSPVLVAAATALLGVRGLYRLHGLHPLTLDEGEDDVRARDELEGLLAGGGHRRRSARAR